MDLKEEGVVSNEDHSDKCREPSSGDRKEPEIGQRISLDNQAIEEVSYKQYFFSNEETGTQPRTLYNQPRGINPRALSSNASESDRSRHSSSWRSRRIYPEGGSSTMPAPCQIDSILSHDFVGSPRCERVDYSGFINSMDDPAFAYFSLIQEYALRRLQGNALQYEGFYRAMACQCPIEERQSRITVIEFEEVGSRSKTFEDYKDLQEYLDGRIEFEEVGSRSKTFEDYKDLQEYLDGRLSKGRPKRLFLLEDLPVRIICLLGSRPKIHPSVFANHYSTEDSSTASDDIAALPSVHELNTRDGLD